MTLSSTASTTFHEDLFRQKAFLCEQMSPALLRSCMGCWTQSPHMVCGELCKFPKRLGESALFHTNFLGSRKYSRRLSEISQKPLLLWARYLEIGISTIARYRRKTEEQYKWGCRVAMHQVCTCCGMTHVGALHCKCPPIRSVNSRQGTVTLAVRKLALLLAELYLSCD